MMSGAKEKSIEADPVVPARVDPDEGPYLRALVGEGETLMSGNEKEKKAEGWDSGSELSEPPESDKSSGSGEKEGNGEKEEKEEKDGDNGRPNFRHTAVDAEALKSDREWFNRGKKGGNSAPLSMTKKGAMKAALRPTRIGKETAEQLFARKKRERKILGNDNGSDNNLGTPRKSVMGGALAKALSEAAEKCQEGGTAKTLRTETQQEGRHRSEMSRGEEIEGMVRDESMDESGLSPTPPRLGSPTPSERGILVPMPVTPTRGRKRMAMGTPAPARRYRHPRSDSLGTFTQTSLAVIEAKLNSKLTSLQIDAEARETRLNERLNDLAAGWEMALVKLGEKLERSERGMETAEARVEERAAVTSEQLENMKRGIIAREEWEDQQWEDLGKQLLWEEEELEGIKRGVDSLTRRDKREKKTKEEEIAAIERKVMEAGLTQMRAPPQASSPPPVEVSLSTSARPPTMVATPALVRRALAPPAPTPVPPRGSPEPAVPEVVMADGDGEDEIEDFSDMEGIQWEGLFDSRHAPPPREPDYMTHSGGAGTERGKATQTKSAHQRERIKA
jgi:hypothetical protein